MSDLYSELLVKKKQTGKDLVVKYGLIALTVILVIGGVIPNGLLLVPAIALGVACYFVIPKTDLEYEYLFVNGELDIDMIMSKSKRKRVKSLQLAEADLVAPLNSHRMDYYNGNQKMKIMDFSSGIGVTNLGYHPHVNQALTEQVGKILHQPNLYHNQLQEDVADLLIGDKDYLAFFCNSVEEANEEAIKIASKESGKQEIITIKN